MGGRGNALHHGTVVLPASARKRYRLHREVRPAQGLQIFNGQDVVRLSQQRRILGPQQLLHRQLPAPGKGFAPRPPLPDGSPAEDKVAAIGIRLRRWVSFHGFSLNVDPDLDHFSGIVPCGIRGYGVTSLVDLGLPVMMSDVDVRIRDSFEHVFGPTVSDAHCQPSSLSQA